MVILTSSSKFMRNLHSVVRPPRKLFVLGGKKSLSGNKGFSLFYKRNARELMLWLIQETIAFVELTTPPKNPRKLSLLSSNTDQRSILQGKTLLLSSVSTYLLESLHTCKTQYLQEILVPAFIILCPQNAEPRVISFYIGIDLVSIVK